MNSLIPEAMAQTAGGAQQASGMSMLVMMGLFVVIFYFLLIRPQQKKQKAHQAMLKQLSAGDEVVLAGGILGRIVELGEQYLTIEIAENVRVKVQRFQVTSLVPKGTIKGA